VAAAAASGREEARREAAERVAGREYHGRRHRRKGIHENSNRLKREEKLGRERRSNGKVGVC